jgi:ubiquinone biosynthesis accessory factor UbiJ
MFDPLFALLRSATLPRAVLLLNHVVAAEPAAMARLAPWAGRGIGIELADLPLPMRFLSPPDAPVVLQVTAAGLFEVRESVPGAVDVPPADLRIRIDASNPLQSAMKAVAGERPDVRIEGDAALAGDVSWLFDNLRWDVQDDLAKLVGPMAAHELSKVGAAVGGALRTVASGVAGVVSTVTGARGPASNGGAGPTSR